MTSTWGPVTITEVGTQRVYRGPKPVIDRLKLPRFGSGVNDKCWHQEETEVFIELTKPIKKSNPDLDSVGFYVTTARNEGWGDTDIRDIVQSENPKELFYKIYLNRLAEVERRIVRATAASLLVTSAPAAPVSSPAAPVTSAPAAPGSPAAPVPEVTTTTSTPVQVASIGLRARLNTKLAENKKQAAVSEDAPKIGISHRLQKMKDDKVNTEQESTLFVRNVPLDYTEQDIRNVLNTQFNVERINIVRKAPPGSQDRVSVGCAFIVLTSKKEAEACITFLDGYRWGHMLASVAFSEPRKG
jgi:hypothetical protein